MAKRTRSSGAARARRLPAMYRESWGEEFEEEFDPEGLSSSVTEAVAFTEAPADADDHTSVSSEGFPGGELFAESPAYGELGAPEAEPDREIEAVAGYQERFPEGAFEEAAVEVGEELLLDAWYADFADAGTRALALQQPTQDESILEVVIGQDDRVRVNSTQDFPWRSICSLLITAQDDSRWIGTGWLAGPRTLITAGHCIYLHNRGGWVASIEVIPGRNGTERPFESCMATTFRSVEGWTHKKQRAHDYGAILLPPDRRYGDELGYLGYADLSRLSLRRLKVNLSGYPGDKKGDVRGTQWFHSRRVRSVGSSRFVYDIDTAGGQSGAPVWRLSNGQRHVVGIHTNGAATGNSATRINGQVFQNIKKWKAEGE